MQTTAMWAIEPRPWEDPEGDALRLAQRAELDERFGCDDHEPGPAPSSEDIAVFLVAVDAQGEAIGCGGLREIDAATAEVKRMYVTPASRGTGAARAILAALEATARERGWTTLRLETGDERHQPDANRFYEREGYRRIPLFGHYVGSDLSICYEKRLACSETGRASGAADRRQDMTAEGTPRPEESPNALDDEGRKTGQWAEKDTHGGFMIGHYVADRREGVWRHYANDGRLRSEGGYSDGRLHGQWTWWRANGRLLQRGGFDHEQRDGLWERWTADGALLDSGHYEQDKKVGEWHTYNADGTIKKTTNHRPRQ